MAHDVDVTLIKACLNGGRSAAAHDAVPVTPEELALDARRAVAAGAGALHVHPRAGDGHETLDGHVCGRAIEAIRRVVPGVPVGLSTGAWIEADASRRLGAISGWSTLPDFVSVNVFEDGVEELCDLLRRLDIGIEAGLWAVDHVAPFLESSWAHASHRILIEAPEGDSSSAVASAVQIDALLEGAGVQAPRLWHGEGIATWAVIAAALERGRDIRIGLENTLVLPDGTTAANNAELVSTAWGLAAHGQGGAPVP